MKISVVTLLAITATTSASQLRRAQAPPPPPAVAGLAYDVCASRVTQWQAVCTCYPDLYNAWRMCPCGTDIYAPTAFPSPGPLLDAAPNAGVCFTRDMCTAMQCALSGCGSYNCASATPSVSVSSSPSVSASASASISVTPSASYTSSATSTYVPYEDAGSSEPCPQCGGMGQGV